MINNREIVEDYSIQEWNSGIIQLFINTKQRWVGYSRMSDTHYHLFISDNETTLFEEVLVIDFKLDESEIFYHRTHMQEKDQITYTFIPYNLLGGNP